MSRQDTLITWAMKYYHKEIKEGVTLFAAKADTDAGDRDLLRKLKQGMTFGHKGWTFESWDFIKPSETPIVPISRWTTKKRTPKSKLNAYISLTTGVYNYCFKNSVSGEKINILYILYEFGNKQDLLSLVVLPFGQLNTWARFEKKLSDMKQPRIKPSTTMAYVVGSCSQDAFKPLYKLDDVILPDRLKEEAVGQIDYFFSEGIKDYAEFSVPPFRKMLIWGVPGTGKSMLAQALAGDQMAKGRVVIFVAASDRFGASFSKIQNALEICKNAKFPVFMVVEEIEAYIAGEEGLSQVRNVLEGFEVPNSKLGSFLLMTSNQPHILDSALLRFGRIDIRKEIPPIKDPATADLLLRKYLGALYPRVEDKIPQAAKLLHNIPPVFVRELAFTARMKAAANPGLDLAAALIETIEELKEQSTNQEAMSKEVEAALRRSQQRESSFPGFLGNMNRMEEETF